MVENKKNCHISRRDFVSRTTKITGSMIMLPYMLGCSHFKTTESRSTLVNDIHSQLNLTLVNDIIKPTSSSQIIHVAKQALMQGTKLSVAGARHAMGGQQFGTHTTLLDMRDFNKIISFDKQYGVIEVQSGITWPDIINYCWTKQKYDKHPWGITQKQTGADVLTLGGALAANIHGRGLTMQPIIQDVISFKLVTPIANEIECSREHNTELFNLVIGGYGLFGIITNIKLRLTPRLALRRNVKILDIEELIPSFEKCIKDGYLYGDFQYMTDPASSYFLKQGVFSCYQPVEDQKTSSEIIYHRELKESDWKTLYKLAFTDKTKAYEMYSKFYLSTHDQLYYSDTHQLSVYLDDYHRKLHKELGNTINSSLMITEIYVPRDKLIEYMDKVRNTALKDNLNIIYGTIRLIKQDRESFLKWAKKDYACIIFNLNIKHTPEGIEKARKDFCTLIDIALFYHGSYYLTYHRWARKDQLLDCYPQFKDFLNLKQRYDSEDLIQSDWYIHYKNLLNT